MRDYTNEQLGCAYFRVATQQESDDGFRFRQRTRGLIQGADVGIQDHYRNHGSLDRLRVKGVGPKTKEVLELIFEHGEDAARTIYGATKDLDLATRRGARLTSSREDLRMRPNP